MNRLAQLRRGQEGFTLIELLVVVAIIALLATFAVPKLFDAINKSKRSPGLADVQTMSGALDRYYMEKNKYPVAVTGTPDPIKTALMQNGFLKAGTKFYNGFDKGYIYVSDAAGNFYVFVDAQKRETTAAMTLQCGATGAKHDLTINTAAKDLAVYQAGSTASDISETDMKDGCKVGTGTGAAFVELPDNADATKAYTVVTN